MMNAQNQAELAKLYHVDENLSDLDKVRKYIISPLPLQRLVYTKRIASCAKEVGAGVTVARLLPLLPNLSEEPEPVVRSAFAGQLGPLVTYLASQGDTAYAAAISDVVPCIGKLIVDEQPDVRQCAGESLVESAKALRSEDVGSKILTMVLNLAHDTLDEYRVTAVSLLDSLAPIVGEQLCHHFVVHELVSFADDPVFKVRKAAAHSYGKICRVAGQATTMSKLFEPYLKLCKDPIWGVRKGCVDSLVAMAEIVPQEEVTKTFIPLFESFARDASRWVRNAAFEVLGKFIHAIGSELATPEFVKWFTNVPSMSSTVVDADVAFSCAFAFPAVVITLGRDRFAELAEMFASLTRDSKFYVRRTLAFSLHEIGTVIGSELAEEHLFPAFELFLHDLDEVRVGAIQNIAKFLQCLSMPKRMESISILMEIGNDREGSWRWREMLAKQLNLLAIIFPPETTRERIIPLALGLCKDNVASVRTQAARYMGHFINRMLQTNAEAYKDLIETIISLADATLFSNRQLFVLICDSVTSIVDHSVFERELLPKLLELSKDRIPNVRVLVAKVLTNSFLMDSHLAEMPAVVEAVALLRADEDKDVVIAANTIHIPVVPELPKEQPLMVQSTSGLINEGEEKKEGDENTPCLLDEDEVETSTSAVSDDTATATSEVEAEASGEAETATESKPSEAEETVEPVAAVEPEVEEPKVEEPKVEEPNVEAEVVPETPSTPEKSKSEEETTAVEQSPVTSSSPSTPASGDSSSKKKKKKKSKKNKKKPNRSDTARPEEIARAFEMKQKELEDLAAINSGVLEIPDDITKEPETADVDADADIPETEAESTEAPEEEQ